MKWYAGTNDTDNIFVADSAVLDQRGSPMIYRIQPELSEGSNDMTGRYWGTIDGLLIHTGTMLKCARVCNELEAELTGGKRAT